MTVSLRRHDGREQSFKIVGEDEADPSRGTLSYVSPLLRALPGEVVVIAGHEAVILECSRSMQPKRKKTTCTLALLSRDGLRSHIWGPSPAAGEIRGWGTAASGEPFSTFSVRREGKQERARSQPRTGIAAGAVV
jgi:hypothetical protein